MIFACVLTGNVALQHCFWRLMLIQKSNTYYFDKIDSIKATLVFVNFENKRHCRTAILRSKSNVEKQKCLLTVKSLVIISLKSQLTLHLARHATHRFNLVRKRNKIIIIYWMKHRCWFTCQTGCSAIGLNTQWLHEKWMYFHTKYFLSWLFEKRPTCTIDRDYIVPLSACWTSRNLVFK